MLTDPTMRQFRTQSLLLAAALPLALLALESSAHAQSVTIPSVPERRLPAGDKGALPDHPDGNALHLNYEDCVRDVVLRIGLVDTI